MPPINQDKFPTAISDEMRLDISAAETFNLQAWLLAVRDWHPFYTPFVAILKGLDEETKLDMARVLVDDVQSSDRLDEGTRFSLSLTLLGPEAINLISQALTTTEMFKD